MSDPNHLDSHPWFREDPDAWVRHIVEIHFHRELGAPYWIKKAEKLGLTAEKDVRTVEDLVLLGPMDEKDLSNRPVKEFIPKILWERLTDLLFVESSGTTGPPKTACFTKSDFAGAFIASFRPVAERVGFPTASPWLFIGPTGPHAIGRAARRLPQVMGSPDPFCVDFDPRWVRKLTEGSVARERYMAHLVDQAEAIVSREPVETIFATPPTLLSLAKRLSEDSKQRVKGIHFGGMEVTLDMQHALWEAFPNAAFLSGYGNSLFGVALEMGGEVGRDMDYFPVGPRHLMRVLKNDGSLEKDAEYGESGRILMSRLDVSGFFPNVLERDHGIRIPPSTEAREYGFQLDGVRNPHPPKKGPRIRTGFY